VVLIVEVPAVKVLSYTLKSKMYFLVKFLVKAYVVLASYFPCDIFSRKTVIRSEWSDKYKPAFAEILFVKKL